MKASKVAHRSCRPPGHWVNVSVVRVPANLYLRNVSPCEVRRAHDGVSDVSPVPMGVVGGVGGSGWPIVPESAVEQLDPGAVPRRAGIYVYGAGTLHTTPVTQRPGDEFESVVRPDETRCSPLDGEAVEAFDEVVGGDRPIDPNVECFPGVFVDRVGQFNRRRSAVSSNWKSNGPHMVRVLDGPCGVLAPAVPGVLAATGGVASCESPSWQNRRSRRRALTSSWFQSGAATLGRTVLAHNPTRPTLRHPAVSGPSLSIHSPSRSLWTARSGLCR